MNRGMLHMGMSTVMTLMFLWDITHCYDRFTIVLTGVCMLVGWFCQVMSIHWENLELGIVESQAAIWSPLVIEGCHCKRCFIRRCPSH